MIFIRTILFSALLFCLGGCYSFKGISIPPQVTTFSVENFINAAPTAPPTLALDFTERLKDKLRNETRLQLRNENADVRFTGNITDYRVVPVAPRPGEVVALNQLVITISVKAENNLGEEVKWPEERTFKHFAEFDNQKDLLSIQDELILQIRTQLLEDIFNHFFNNW